MANAVLNLINDILDLLKVESGRLELESSDFNLNELVEKTTEFLAIRAHKKGIVCTKIKEIVELGVNIFRKVLLIVRILYKTLEGRQKGD